MRQVGTSSVPTSTPTSKTRVANTTKKKKEEETKVKPTESQRGKPSKIQFRRKGKTIEPHVVPTQIGRRKKEKAHKLVIDIEETKSEEDKRALRASAKKQKTTQKEANVNVAIKDNQKDLVDEEDEALVKEHTVENLQPVIDTTEEEETEKDEAEKKTEKVEEERTMEEIKTSPEIPSESKLKKTIVDDDYDSMRIKGPININNLSYLELMEIATAMQSWEQVENKGEEKEANKSSTEQPVNTQSTETQTTPDNISVDANVNVATKDNQKDLVDKEEEALVKEHTVENLQLDTDTTEEEETRKDEAKKKTEKLLVDANEQLKSLEEVAHALVEKDYKKRRGEQLISESDKGKVPLTIKKDLLKTRLDTGGEADKIPEGAKETVNSES
ncbi:peptidyl-prolyl cis-trans isomerase-like [Cryptomeria japonica]|uniref:peptidyl-prolyl cis-trans isomerase-like n=1 Tax=Cryptomeria japonica TaxID=3369 RepID=UPI0025AD8145|nr:peptidyl-prolyl cis-trans isomerase-like [Cryptomeria japonica]